MNGFALLPRSRRLLALVLLACPGHSGRGEEVIVPRGGKSTWRYLDAGHAVEQTWRTKDFDDSKWKSGPAPLGYGEPDMGTTVSFGPDANGKPITTFFRRNVDMPDPAKFETILIQLRRDDGAVVYWNGKEIVRSNMPEGIVLPDTPAVQALSEDTEGEFHRYVIPAKDLVSKGGNVLAVEVHQAYPESSDLIFDLEATAFAPGESPKTDYRGEATRALRAGDKDRAASLLLKVDPASPDYAALMKGAAALFASGGRTPDSRYFDVLEKACAAAPADMELVYSYIRARVDARKDLPVKPARRELPAAIPEEFRFIADSPEGKDSSPVFSRADLLADVDDLELILENCYAYLERRGANYRSALDALRASLADQTGRDTFNYRVSRVLTVFGDPHSSTAGGGRASRRVPVLFVMDGDRLAALRPDRSGFFDEARPYVAEINGRPASEWLAAAEHLVPQASPQYRRSMALHELTGISTVAREMMLPSGGVTMIVESADRSDRTTHELKTSSGSLRDGGTWPAGKSELRPDGIGYLRIPQMESSDRFIASLNQWMAKFADTRALIIDVRGNSGGTQDAIKTLLPWLMEPGAPMKIINVAAYRLPIALPKPNPSGFLGLFGRGLHPATSKVWAPDQAAQIRTFLSTWRPQWDLPAGKFSDWHVMGITQDSNPAAEYYGKPVIVLENEECFSATDNFLGALKGNPNVTLMGTPSGGGSGRMASYRLPKTGIELTLCQMASFSAAGYTYDGNGVTPDFLLAPKLEDQINGHGDSVLVAAVARLLK